MFSIHQCKNTTSCLHFLICASCYVLPYVTKYCSTCQTGFSSRATQIELLIARLKCHVTFKKITHHQNYKRVVLLTPCAPSRALYSTQWHVYKQSQSAKEKLTHTLLTERRCRLYTPQWYIMYWWLVGISMTCPLPAWRQGEKRCTVYERAMMESIS